MPFLCHQRFGVVGGSLVVGLLSACAGPRGAAPARAPTIVHAPAAPSRAAPPPPARLVDGADGLAALCEQLLDEDRVATPGNPIEAAELRDARRARRQEALAARYYVDVAASDFAFLPYDFGEHVLSVAPRGFVVGDGAEIDPAEPGGALDFDLRPETAGAAVDGQSAGQLRLRLVFRPARSEMRQDYCLRASGGRIVKLSAQVLGAYLIRADGSALAQQETDELAQVVAAVTPVRDPVVAVRRPTSDDQRAVPDDVASAAQKLARAIEPCYRETLKAHPGARGTLVMLATLGADGHLDSPQMEVSSVGDDALVTCVAGKLATSRLPGAATPLRLSIPIAFGSKDESPL